MPPTQRREAAVWHCSGPDCLACFGSGVGIVPLFQVGAGAEGAAHAGDDGAAEGRFVVVPCEEGVEVGGGAGGDAVQG